MNRGARTFNSLPSVLAIAISLLATASLGQTSLGDVHVGSRDIHASTPTVKNSSPQKELSTSLKVDVDLVLVPVTVTDDSHRMVLGLDKENFQIFENKQSQPLQTFSRTDMPISIGLIFDTSGSMSTKIDRAREAVGAFLKTANPQDEFFVITFADTPSGLVDFTTSTEEVQNKLLFATPRGMTSLLDAIYLGVSKLRQAQYSKKALLIISDGGDNHSRYTERDVKNIVKESDVMVYAIGVYDRYFRTEEERLGPGLLSDISELTGGRSFSLDNLNDLPDVASKIGVELRNQYVLGYRPTKAARDGKWHKIKVKLLAPKGLPPLQVFARQGYYARTE
jgi:Ca-activated chloride channel homolog